MANVNSVGCVEEEGYGCRYSREGRTVENMGHGARNHTVTIASSGEARA
jgi:hypothetical protein